MQPHFFISDNDGALYDTRDSDWSKQPPLRANYRLHHLEIAHVADLKATLRAGSHTDLGGYPLYFITSDGAALSFEAVRDNFRTIADSIENRINDGWHVVACAINYEDEELTCDHSGKRIPSAYGDAPEESA